MTMAYRGENSYTEGIYLLTLHKTITTPIVFQSMFSPPSSPLFGNYLQWNENLERYPAPSKISYQFFFSKCFKYSGKIYATHVKHIYMIQ